MSAIAMCLMRRCAAPRACRPACLPASVHDYLTMPESFDQKLAFVMLNHLDGTRVCAQGEASTARQCCRGSCIVSVPFIPCDVDCLGGELARLNMAQLARVMLLALRRVLCMHVAPVTTSPTSSTVTQRALTRTLASKSKPWTCIIRAD